MAALTPTLALAAEVNLRSADGTVDLSGELIDFVDDNYVIRTALGDLRISAARVSCTGEACPVFDTGTADTVIVGSGTVGVGLMPLLLTGYASSFEAEASIKATRAEGEIIANLVSDGGFGEEMGSFLVTPTSVESALRALVEGSATFGMSDRRISDEETRLLEAAGAGDMQSPAQEHIIAVDSIVVITHPSNPVNRLTMEQVADIYAGRIRNWSEVGGPTAPINVITRDRADGAAFFASVYGDAARAPRYGTVTQDANTMAAAVNADENAIGFVGYAFQRGAKPISLVNACGIATTPDAFSAKTEEYPLQRRLYLYNTATGLDAEGRKFLEYVTSSQADSVIAKAGFIDFGVATQAMDRTSHRARQLSRRPENAIMARAQRVMWRDMLRYERLSTTFRFRTGSSRLDERALIDMERLVAFLEDKPEGTEIKIVGFTDSVGTFESNQLLAERRAAQVAADLAAFAGDRLDGVALETAGYGEVAPAACNATNLGRSINRRVEVWIKPAARS